MFFFRKMYQTCETKYGPNHGYQTVELVEPFVCEKRSYLRVIMREFENITLIFE